MPLFGSDGGFQADNRGGVIDGLGNTVVSANTDFGASPLGVAARTQALYGIPNATFNLLPPDPSSPIVPNQNDLPYWDINNLSDEVMSATAVFDAATQTWGIELNPGTAASGATLTLSTRSYLITDDNLALRQKALAVLSKSGTAAVSTEWNLTLSAIYYDGTDTALSTAFIGTALDTGSWTSMSGTTTPGGSAINAAAQYVDLTFTLTATAAVTGSAKATIKSLLLTTSTAATGSFLVAETYTSSTTWNVPTGVTSLYAIVGAGAGGGGASGGFIRQTDPGGTPTIISRVSGSGGGGAGAWAIVRDVAIGTATSISIGIGAGGAGGTANSRAGTTANPIALNGANGAGGATTTAGVYLTLTGGGGGIAGTVSSAAPPTTALSAPSGGTAGQFSTSYYGAASVAGATGGAGGTVSGTVNNPGTGILTVGVGGVGSSAAAADRLIYPYNTITEFGAAGSASTTSGTFTSTQSGTAGTANAGTATWGGGAGGSGGAFALRTNTGAFEAKAAASGNGAVYGGGGGGGASFAGARNGSTAESVAGVGGAGATNSGGGGGAGGALALVAGAGTASTGENSSGAGGAGANGFVTIVYVA